LVSNWRLNCWRVGRIGPYQLPAEPESYMTLVAELTSPFFVGGLLYKWVYQKWTPYGIRGGLGLTTLSFPNQLLVTSEVFTGRFPYGYSVLPDT
jgi:hypothetical protein